MIKLFIVPTPIGNLKDITFKAIEVLQNVDLILAEDTRVSKKLLNHYNIKTPLGSYHQHNEHKNTKNYIQKILEGKKIAIISDAGTPGISDAGFMLIRESLNNGIQVECLPGPTALIPAVVQSGLPCDRFLFEGFLPVKRGRRKKLAEIALETKTIILYESPHRIIKTLSELYEHCGSREVSVVKELTKVHESLYKGTLNTIVDIINVSTIKGEYVIVLQGHEN